MDFCGDCGQKIDSKFCTNCGSKTGDSVKMSSSPLSSQQNMRMDRAEGASNFFSSAVWLLICVVTLGLAYCVYVYITLHDIKKHQSLASHFHASKDNKANSYLPLIISVAIGASTVYILLSTYYALFYGRIDVFLWFFSIIGVEIEFLNGSPLTSITSVFLWLPGVFYLYVKYKLLIRHLEESPSSDEGQSSFNKQIINSRLGIQGKGDKLPSLNFVHRYVILSYLSFLVVSLIRSIVLGSAFLTFPEIDYIDLPTQILLTLFTYSANILVVGVWFWLEFKWHHKFYDEHLFRPHDVYREL